MIDRRLLDKLEEYVDLEESEVGEMCSLLLQLAGYPDYITPEFHTILEDEIKKNLEMFKHNTKIVTTEKAITQTVTELKWYFE